MSDKKSKNASSKAAAEQEQATETTPFNEEVAAKLSELEAENGRLRDQMLRVRAEFENFRRRRNKELEEFQTLANEGLIEDLLPVLDDFKLLFDNADKTSDPSSLLAGARLIESKLGEVLKRRGLEEVAAEGQPFDPEVHEALLEQPSDEVEPGTVLAVHQSGYKLGAKLLRPSRVIVSTTTDQG